MKEKLKILLVTPEIYPFLMNTVFARILYSFAKGLSDAGCDIRVVMPKYKRVNCKSETLIDFPVTVDWMKQTAILRETVLENGDKLIPVYLIDNYQYFDRDQPYNYFDEAERFSYFCRAVLEMLPKIDFKPDIIQCNDWETGPISVMLKEQYGSSDFYKDIKSIFTIHNVKYQGNYPFEVLKLLNLDNSYFSPDKLEFYGNVSFLKAGLMYSDIITTLGRIYATKLQTSDYGERMDGVLQYRRNDFYGIVNGIDYDRFNPETDTYLYSNYSVNDLGSKKRNKFNLQSELGLPIKDVPVIAIVTKFQRDKGFELLFEILNKIMENDIQLIIFGGGDVEIENRLIQAKGKFTDKIGLWIGNNEELEHRIYAGSDMLLMASKLEVPYRQMIAMRYGTIPIIKSDGDVDDVVVGFDFRKKKGTGFIFPGYSSVHLLDVIKRVINLYMDKKDIWEKIMIQAMNEDFSFSRTLREYMEIYKLALRKKE